MRWRGWWSRAALVQMPPWLAVVLVLAMLLPEPPLWENWQWLDRLINLLWLCAAGVVTYFSALFVSGGRPRDFKAASNTQG